MSIDIGYTDGGDLRITCGTEERIWPLAGVLKAAISAAGMLGPDFQNLTVSEVRPAPDAQPTWAPAPMTPAAPSPPPEKTSIRTKPKVGWPKPLPGVTALIGSKARRAHFGMGSLPWVLVDIDEAMLVPGAGLPQAAHAGGRMIAFGDASVPDMLLGQEPFPTLLVQPSDAPRFRRDMKKLQALAAQAQSGPEEIKLVFLSQDLPKTLPE